MVPHYLFHRSAVSQYLRRLHRSLWPVAPLGRRRLLMDARSTHPMPENPRDLSTYKGFRFRKLNRQTASRLVEVFRICHCTLCKAPLERDHRRFLASETELSSNGIEPADTSFEHAHIVWVPNGEEPIIFCDKDYSQLARPCQGQEPLWPLRASPAFHRSTWMLGWNSSTIPTSKSTCPLRARQSASSFACISSVAPGKGN